MGSLASWVVLVCLTWAAAGAGRRATAGRVERRPGGAAALEAVRNGTGRLLFRHVRKAGGTSALKVLEAVAAELMVKNNRSSELAMQHMEFSTFPVSCFVERPEALYVTVVREPLSRVHSEYWYRGPKVANVTVYAEWIVPKAMTQGEAPPGAYVDNLFVRSFSGRCVRPTDPSKYAPRHTDARPAAVRYYRLWDNDVCGMGYGGWRGGCRFDENDRVTTDESDLKAALGAIDRFDVVVVLEWLKQALYLRFLASTFGVRSLEFARVNTKERHSGGKWEPQPATIAAQLRKQEHHDAAFYDRARRNQAGDVSAWLAGLKVDDAQRRAWFAFVETSGTGEPSLSGAGHTAV